MRQQTKKACLFCQWTLDICILGASHEEINLVVEEKLLRAKKCCKCGQWGYIEWDLSLNTTKRYIVRPIRWILLWPLHATEIHNGYWWRIRSAGEVATWWYQTVTSSTDSIWLQVVRKWTQMQRSGYEVQVQSAIQNKLAVSQASNFLSFISVMHQFQSTSSMTP